MMNLVRFRSVTRSDRESPYQVEATWNHRVSSGLNASQSARNASRPSYSPRSNQLPGIAPLFWRRPRHLDIESPVLIVAHHGQSFELTLNFNQPFQNIATNDNLPLAAFAQRLQMQSVQTKLLRQIGKKPSIYDLPLVYFCILIRSFLRSFGKTVLWTASDNMYT